MYVGMCTYIYNYIINYNHIYIYVYIYMQYIPVFPQVLLIILCMSNLGSLDILQKQAICV